MASSKDYTAQKPVPWSRRKRLLALSAEEKVRVYTYQHRDALTEARARGYFTGSHDFVAHGVSGAGLEQEYTPCYDWMRDQMRKRLVNFSGDYPVWAYLKRPSARSFVPQSWDNPVRITALVPRRRLLISDFDLWHSVMGGWPISLTEEEFKSWEPVWTPGEPVPGAETTWERVFDLSPRPPDQHAWVKQPNWLQACVDRIYLDDIVDVRTMTSPPKDRLEKSPGGLGGS